MARVLFVTLWVVLFCSLAYVSLPNYDIRERIDSKAVRTIQTDNVSRLWLSPAGELAAYGVRGVNITARVWASASGALLHERTLELASPAKASAPVFAISNDVSQIAWLSPAGLNVERLFPPSGSEPAVAVGLPLRRPVPISSLAFTGASTLGILYEDGDLELWDLANHKLTASKSLGITDPGPLLGNGSYLATYSLSSNHAFVLDTGSGDRLSLLENSQHPSKILLAALSAKGRLAVVLGDKLELQGKSVGAPGVVRALDFFDFNRVFIAGDFANIFLLGPHDPTIQAAAAGPGATTLAATGSLLAYGTNTAINLAPYRVVQIREYRGFSRPSTWLAIAFLGLIAPFAIPLFQGAIAFLKQLLRLRLPQPTVKSALPVEDDSMPNFLVDACQNGDCVLFAGAGLSAQAGLPLWNEAVGELATWAIGEGLLASEAKAAVLDHLSRNRTGAAANRLAAVLADHEQALQTYLRGRYRVTTELPAAHQLIKGLDFPALITTTFDNLLDRTFPYSGGRVYTAQGCVSLANAAARRDFFLLKPFGDLDELNTIRLGPAQCAQTFEENPACPDFIEHLLQLRTFLFLGASLEGIEEVFNLITLGSPIEHKHFAFVAVQGDGWKEAAARLHERYGIQTVTYSPAAPAHSELVDFLTRLSAAVHDRTSERKHFTAGENS
jgi:hypothetical protein